ncbi:MAG: type II secretion system protein GspM [Aestuariivirga sp.]|uniref:type II secretion system protein GspM n=1 Tax=Aestuariivirga sp. TaxID=2650926 RepID=UPI0038CF5C3D
MTALRLSAEARRGLAIVAGAILIAGVSAAGLAAWHGSLEERVAQQQAERDLLAARVEKKVRDGAGRLTAADGPERLFLTGATPGLTMAGFQELVGGAAATSGLSVLRIQPFEASDGEGSSIPAYRLGIDAEGSLEQLRAFLISIEAMLPLMFVTGLEIRPQSAAGAADPYPSEALRASFRVEAHGWSEQP